MGNEAGTSTFLKFVRKLVAFFLCSFSSVEAQESPGEEKREGGCGGQEVKYVFLRRLN